jgi:hypothetical protein
MNDQQTGQEPREPRALRTTSPDGDHGLIWPIRASFFDYITSMPDGEWSATDGAELVGRNTFHFRSQPRSGDHPTTLRFAGEVTFAGHFGFLFVSIRNPWIDLGEPRSRLTVDDTDPETAGERFVLATCSVTVHHRPDGGVAVEGRDVQLSDEGSAMFFGKYRPGDHLDEFSATC